MRSTLKSLFSAKALIVAFTIMNVCIGGGTLYCWRKIVKNRLVNQSAPANSGPLTILHPQLAANLPNVDVRGKPEARVPIVVDSKLTYDKVESLTRSIYRTALDIGWREWQPTGVAFKTQNPANKFDPEQMSAPDSAEIKRITESTPIVRPLPYPFFTAFAVPSDCCGSTPADPYYMHSIVSRKYGLDMPGSFFPYSSSDPELGPTFALFAGRSFEPARYPIDVECEQIDMFPLLLTYFHRGWIDHIHDWSAGVSTPLSLVEIAIAKIDERGSAEVEIKGVNRAVSIWCSLQVEIEVSPDVTNFEIQLRDRAGTPHWIVYRMGLEGRPGWDLSRLSRAQLSRCMLDLRQESNPPPQSVLGKRLSGPFQGGVMRVEGKAGATATLKSVVAVDVSREMVASHAKTMKRYNLLPIASTWHGGANSWTSFLHNSDYEASDGKNGKTKVKRPALGQDPTSQSYVGDIIGELGVKFFSDIDSISDAWLPSPFVGQIIQPKTFQDGSPYYFNRRNYFKESPNRPFVELTNFKEHAENLGTQFASALLSTNKFGDGRVIYTHFNHYNGNSFNPKREGALNLSQIKHVEPFSDEMLQCLSNLAYNLDGKRKPHQRVWVAPVSTLYRFAQAQRHIEKHTTRVGNDIHISPWTDEVTNAQFPDATFASQDLNGQTFYVNDSVSARVFVGEKEIRSLQRNAADFTGRQSVTIVDTHCPTVIADELDFLESNGRLEPRGASCYFQQRNAYSGTYATEIQLEKNGKGMICWKPYSANNHETTHLRFAYKKSNPKSRLIIGWSQDGESPQFLATDGELGGIQGWQLPCREDGEYHEVVLDFASMRSPEKGTKRIARGPVKCVYFGLEGDANDRVFFDKVEFLSARGVRPHAGNGLVVGGRIYPPCDGEKVCLNIAGVKREVETDRGGWYLFSGVPAGAIAEITYDRAGVTYYPERGRLAQIEKNDIENHIFALDPRSPSIPRPDFRGQKVPDELVIQVQGTDVRPFANLCVPSSRRFYAGNVGNEMEYVVEDWLNNRGWYDRDRRPENPDGAVRIFLHGTCLEEGAQTPLRDHLNIVLESILRRRTGVNVEVAAASHSNSSIAANSYLYEKYGRTMKPDFVVLMNDPVNMWHLEPTLLERNIGWTKGHTPYRGFDFDNDGKLVEFPPDPNFSVFSIKPDPKPLVGNLSLSNTYLLLSEYPPLIERSFQLFQAIAKTRYVDDLSKRGGRLIVASGYHGNDFPSRGMAVARGEHQLSTKKYLSEMRRVTEAAGGIFVDLSGHTRKYDYSEVMSFGKADGHLTTTGHYIIANALAEQILELPEFRQLIESRKKDIIALRR